MNKASNHQEEEWIQKRLRVLQELSGEARTPGAENAGRARFLSDAAALRQTTPRRSSLAKTARHMTAWQTIQSLFSGRSARLVFSAVTAVFMVIALLLASGGTLVYAAQDSQPNQILYPVKLFSEDVRLDLADNPQSQFDLNLEFANRRLDEIDRLSQAGQEVGTEVTDRLQNELNAAVDNAGQMDDTGAVKALENLQANLVRHTEQLSKLQSQANPHAVENYTRVVDMLQQKVNLAQEVIKDPQAIHQLIKEQQQLEKQAAKNTPTTGALNSSEKDTNTPAAEEATGTAEPKNNPANCNALSNNSNSNNGNNGNGNGNDCNQPNTQDQVVTTPPHVPPGSINTPKPDNPNKPEEKDDKSNKGGKGKGHNK